MDERAIIPAAGLAILDGLNAFRGRNAGRDIQRIALPKGNFMLRAGDDIFSSLTPNSAPQVINLPSGQQFYDHGNYIISTVGLNPDTGEVAEGVNQLGRSFSNHWGLRRSPQIYQQLFDEHMLLPRTRSKKVWYTREGRDMDDPYDPTGIVDLVYSGILEAIDPSAIYPRHVLHGLNAYPISPTAGLKGTAGAPREETFLTDATVAALDDVYKMFKDRGEITHNYLDWNRSGPRATGEGSAKTGVLQTENPDLSSSLTAFAGGKQIVAHPDEVIPDEMSYPLARVHDPNKEKAEIIIPWVDVPEPTRILQRVNPWEHGWGLSWGERFNPYYMNRFDD